MSSASSAVTYTSVYTESEPRRVFWGADEELSDGGSPRVIVCGYDGLPMQPIAPPSPNYIPGPEEPQTPPVPQDKDEREPMFIQLHDPDYVSEPMYPEYIPLEDEHVFPAEEQPLPPVISPTAESPGYVVESDPEEDPEEYEGDEIEDGPVDYPIDRGDDRDDDDGGLHGDDADDEDEDEDEEDEEEEEEEINPLQSDTKYSACERGKILQSQPSNKLCVGTISINRGLIQAIPTSLPPQPIEEATKASIFQRIPPRIFFDYRVTLGFGSTGDLDLACPINRLPCHDGIQWVLGRITNSLPGTMAGVDIDTLTMEQYLALYCPPSMTAKQLEDIHNFNQEGDESLYQAWERSRNDGLSALVNKLDNLGRDIKKLKESVHAIQVGCQICKGPHLDKDCPLNEEVKQIKEVRYGEFGRTTPFNGNNGGRQNLAETVKKYIKETSLRLEKQDEWLKTFCHNLEKSQNHHNEIIQGLQFRVTTLAKEAVTKIDKNEDCKAIFTSDGAPLYTLFCYSPEEIEYFLANSGFSDDELNNVTLIPNEDLKQTSLKQTTIHYVEPYIPPIPFPMRLEQHAEEALIHKTMESP
ncbi:hypothetical protein Tco_0580448 [Tanacetum coccineum]